MHWENEFSSSRRQKYPLSLQDELRGLPQPLLKLQVKLLLPFPVKIAQGSRNKGRLRGFPCFLRALKSSGLSEHTECLAGVLSLCH